MQIDVPAIERLKGLFADYLSGYRERGLKVMATSSFQTHSIPMLHLISELDAEIPIYFLNTGFHFPETLHFRDEVAEKLGLDVRSVGSPVPKVAQRDAQGKFYFTTDPDRCCHLNKTLPMEPVLHEFDIWITGVRKDQNNVRSSFAYESPGKHNTTRFHPMLEWSNKLIFDYIRLHNLPKHPLENEGYMSIGCEPCTLKITASMLEHDRSGRWFGLNKNECGLHTELVEQA